MPEDKGKYHGKHRDETNDPGSGRRRLSRSDKGKLSKDAEDPEGTTHPPTTGKKADDK